MSSDSSSDEESTRSSSDIEENITVDNNVNVYANREIIEIFKHNEQETKNDCILLNVKKTIREFIFPMMKFTNEDVLRKVKLNEENNILHILLKELNRLDDSNEKRARFWLRYKKEITNVLTSRKTEISNGLKQVVFEGMLILYKFIH